ncbi:hypothetical protein [Persephonella sp.]|uniref:hypothetical protein n=1 Tax=Persephonella sp. TaxID=2060922 RepID=UPI0026094DE0|nr:hypothetical protein [Persephonella sp.]
MEQIIKIESLIDFLQTVQDISGFIATISFLALALSLLFFSIGEIKRKPVLIALVIFAISVSVTSLSNYWVDSKYAELYSVKLSTKECKSFKKALISGKSSLLELYFSKCE